MRSSRRFNISGLIIPVPKINAYSHERFSIVTFGIITDLKTAVFRANLSLKSKLCTLKVRSEYGIEIRLGGNLGVYERFIA
ncbi:MAG: hypothetical protein M0Z75_01620 [Nitrospiraceae bacterium]|nr:hypothetical protein [Nitrospiraceae bacterium]